MAKKADLDMLKALPQKAAKIVANYRDAVSRVNAKAATTFGDEPLLSKDERTKAISDLREKALAQLAALETKGQEAIDRLAGRDTKPSGDDDSTSALVKELRAERAWLRTKALLDAGVNNRGAGADDPLTVMREAIRAASDAGDEVLLGVLQEELPAYLKSKNLTEYADVLPKLFDNPGGVTGLRKQAAANEFDAGWSRTQVAFAHSRRAIEESDSPVGRGQYGVPITMQVLIPDWEDGALIEVVGVDEETHDPRNPDGSISVSKHIPQLAVVD